MHGDNAASINAGGNAAHVQLFVYGWPPSGSFATNWGVNTVTFSKNDGELDALVNTISEEQADRMALRYVGPIPPYSFADVALEA